MIHAWSLYLRLAQIPHRHLLSFLPPAKSEPSLDHANCWQYLRARAVSSLFLPPESPHKQQAHSGSVHVCVCVVYIPSKVIGSSFFHHNKQVKYNRSSFLLKTERLKVEKSEVAYR